MKDINSRESRPEIDFRPVDFSPARLPALLDELNRQIYRDPKNGLLRAQALKRAARASGHIALSLQALGLCVEAAHIVHNTALMQECIEEIRSFADNVPETPQRCLYDTILGTSLAVTGQLTEAAGHLHNAVRLAELDGGAISPRIRGQTLICLGMLYKHIGSYSKALEFWLRANRIAEYERPSGQSVPLLCNIGGLYAMQGDGAQAKAYFDCALERAQRQDSDFARANALIHAGEGLVVLGEIESATEHYRQAIVLYRNSGARRERALALRHLGTALRKAGQPQEALEHLQESLSILSGRGEPGLLSSVLHEIGACHSAMQRMPQSLRFLRRALQLAIEDQDLAEQSDLHKRLAELYEQQGKLQDALRQRKQFEHCRETLLNLEQQREFARIELRDNLERAERTSRQLLRRSEAAELRLAEKTEAAGTLALRLVQREQALRHLRQQISEYGRNARGPGRDLVARLLAAIDSLLKQEQQEKGTELKLETLFGRFVAALRRRESQLSAAEIRICILLRLHLASKEIADILFKSEATIRTQRRDIRRKLGLNRAVNLESFLASLDDETAKSVP